MRLYLFGCGDGAIRDVDWCDVVFVCSCVGSHAEQAMIKCFTNHSLIFGFIIFLINHY